jgi:hypothetical protein
MTHQWNDSAALQARTQSWRSYYDFSQHYPSYYYNPGEPAALGSYIGYYVHNPNTIATSYYNNNYVHHYGYGYGGYQGMSLIAGYEQVNV